MEPSGEGAHAADDERGRGPSPHVHEYADDEYDPEHGGIRPHAPSAAEREHDGLTSGTPRRSNRTRILIGLAGLLAALALFNVGLDILSEPPDAPAPAVPPRPTTSASPSTAPPGSTSGSTSAAPTAPPPEGSVTPGAQDPVATPPTPPATSATSAP